VTEAKRSRRRPSGLRGLDERWTTVRGARLRYFVGGAGPPLLLVHGLGGAASNWIELAPLLARRRRLLVPDLPGHAGSAALPAAPTLSAFADCVAEVAEREAMLPAPVVGHSMGGLAALRLALRRPDAITGLVLAAAAGISSATRVRQTALTVVLVLRPTRLVAPFRTLVARVPWLRYPVFGHFEVADPPALSAEAVTGFLDGAALHTNVFDAGRALVADDPRLDLERVRCPSLVLWGARDRMVPVADGFEYARRLGAPIRVLADCGHLLIAERPLACLDAIDEFLAGFD
jgi:pimeloyl-ACP methyl ester carboxylesterase